MSRSKQSIGMRGDKHVAHKEQKGVHSYSQEEKEAFVGHINFALRGDSMVSNLVPMDPSELFARCKSGVLLCKLINHAVPGTIDERVINVAKAGRSLGVFQSAENCNLAIGSSAAIGCKVVNVGAEDIQAQTAHIVLGLIWQIIRVGLLARITLTNHPELYRLLLDGEQIEDFLALPADQILIRWVNYHLANAGSEKRIRNFGGDIHDSEAYTILLNQLAPDKCSTAALGDANLESRAATVLASADRLVDDAEGQMEWCKFMKPRDIVSGNKKLNLAFVADLFNTCPGLDELEEEQVEEMGDIFGAEGAREARAFTLWLNSLGIDPYVNNLFKDLVDGLVLLRAMDTIEPGTVNWKGVKQVNLSKFSQINNCNIAVDTGKKNPFEFSLVGIQGNDINVGNRTLTLSVVWQLMRHHVISILKDLSDVQTMRGTNFKPIEEKEVIAWANQRVGGAGKQSSMRSFHDASLSTGVFFIDLCAAIRPDSVKYEYVTAGKGQQQAMDNAKYAISVARKIGAVLFLVPEDVVEVKSKMLLTFTAALMFVDQQMKKGAPLKSPRGGGGGGGGGAARGLNTGSYAPPRQLRSAVSPRVLTNTKNKKKKSSSSPRKGGGRSPRSKGSKSPRRKGPSKKKASKGAATIPSKKPQNNNASSSSQQQQQPQQQYNSTSDLDRFCSLIGGRVSLHEAAQMRESDIPTGLSLPDKLFIRGFLHSLQN